MNIKSESLMTMNDVEVNKRGKGIPFNWPVVGVLLFLTAIPGIPAMFILASTTIDWSNAALFVHGSSGILFFLTMPFQFSPALRLNNVKRHKTAGRVALIAAYVMGLSAIWLHYVLYGGVFSARYLSLVLMSIAMCLAFSLALKYILKGNVQLHRQWMARAVAITLAAVTSAFVEIIQLLLFGQFESTFAVVRQFQQDYGRLVAIAINVAIVEYVFLKAKRKQLSQALITG